MSLPYQLFVRQCARTSGLAIRTASHRPGTALSRSCPACYSRWQTTEAAAAANPKISGIVDQISQLTLLETADLVSTLKTRLNIPDMPIGGFAAAGASPAATAAPAAVEEDEPAPKAEEKTLFNLKLESFDPATKPKVIKEIKSMLGLSLVDSKKFVESAPKMMKEAVPKEEAEKMIELLKSVGAVVKME